MASSEQVVVVASVKAKPGKVEEVIEGFTPVIEQTHEEEGCIAYALHRDVNDPETLVLVERWASQEDLDLHFQKPYMAVMVELMTNLLAEQPTIIFTRPEPIGQPGKGTLEG